VPAPTDGCVISYVYCMSQALGLIIIFPTEMAILGYYTLYHGISVYHDILYTPLSYTHINSMKFIDIVTVIYFKLLPG
jgi:hypothetical protein